MITISQQFKQEVSSGCGSTSPSAAATCVSRRSPFCRSPSIWSERERHAVAAFSCAPADAATTIATVARRGKTVQPCPPAVYHNPPHTCMAHTRRRPAGSLRQLCPILCRGFPRSLALKFQKSSWIDHFTRSSDCAARRPL